MRVFVTGATGFIGAAIVPELLQAGHQVLGLTRSDAGAESLAAAGAQVHRGDLEDLESLKRGADLSDAVIHTAFNHDFSKFAENCETDRRVIEAMGGVLAGTNKVLIITSGTGISSAEPGRPASENDPPVPSSVIPRAASEEAAAAMAARGVCVSIVRLPQVHDAAKQGLVSYLIQIARQKGVSGYVGDGGNRWPAVHRFDASHLYCLAVAKGEADAHYNAVAEEGVSMREIAETIARGLKLPAVSIAPEQAPAHFGWLAMFAGRDLPASSAITREKLGWRPTGPGLISDLENMRYS